MKTILRITVILIVAAMVAGGLHLVANNTSLASSPDREGHQPPALTDASGQSFQTRERQEGGEHGASLSRGLAGVAGTLVKLTVITIIVLLVQKGFSLLGNRNHRPKGWDESS
jgi:hypothetical protein